MQRREHMKVSVFQKAKKGNYYCGDSYFYHESDGKYICALADGLGSGELARESSQIVMDVIREYRNESVKTIMKKSSEKLMGKRGVVLGILRINFMTKQYTYSSIGNIGLMTINAQSTKKRNIPLAGYLSSYEKPFKEMTGELEPDMIFIMFSDGVQAREVSNPYFHHREVEHITDTFAYLNQQPLEDDTTLIAMKYYEESL
ncbi:protein phosphatase 2C domain-containing protein [Gracilibacillus sp. S3-1-1]|uniref:Protein phosphatase 2C domain-containing protein n=1 Tax=Gracilibacillus pellucidus TaxID=3095368 RepID=A0ACC6M5X5_9BACI|nr:protein phosphatase 2C domain-containing protein [Gracilibacillus sp. S3-1-1]MDX8046301.1 protein phosphatase 2C domain-containing protein [Gracilibacillus sp. S3-1-1]